ncbi:MAG: hypothetical protein ACRCX2_26830 [Paraclostridium sp.]
MNMTQMCSKCGLVKFYVMKLHIVLQALSSLQAHTNDLRILYIDSNIGTRKAWNEEALPPMKH